MKSHSEIKVYLSDIVTRELPKIKPDGLRSWISERLTDPYPVKLSVDPEGNQMEDFWNVTDHKKGKHYRIAYSTVDNTFGIVTPLQTGIEWYMGNYGTFKEAVEGM